MNILPEALFFTLERIKGLAKRIKDNADRVKANKHQCKSLSQRITRITAILNTNAQMKQIHPSLNTALENFFQYLIQCNTFIEKFAKDGWFARIRHNCNYSKQFRQLNEELSHHCQDLQLSIALHGLFLPAQDTLDAQQDLQEIEQMITRTRLLTPQALPNDPNKITAISRTNSPSPLMTHQSAIIKTPQTPRATKPSSTTNSKPHPLANDQLKRHHHHHLKI